MRYKRFGKTELQVSEMCLGTWGIGGAGWDSNSEETRLDAIYAAVEAGINFIDTAPAYNADDERLAVVHRVRIARRLLVRLCRIQRCNVLLAGAHLFGCRSVHAVPLCVYFRPECCVRARLCLCLYLCKQGRA